MKAGLIAASAVALLQLASAQPHGHRHAHERREVDVTTTIVIPEVVVYVDENGNAISTETKSVQVATEVPTSSSTSTPATTTPSSSSSSTVATSSSDSAVQAYEASVTTSSSVAATTSAAATATAASSSSSDSGVIFGSSLKGFTYNAYNDDGSCRAASDVASDIASAASEGYNAVRIYAVDCDTVSSVVPAAKKAGIAVLAGLFSLSSIESDFASMGTQLDGDYSYLSAISVGNELINSGEASASQMVAAVQQVKSLAAATNFAGKVTTVDTFNALLEDANSAVLDAVDFIAANCHAVFSDGVSAATAGEYVKTACIDPLTEKADGKSVVITESGWPCYNPGDSAITNLVSTVAQDLAVVSLKTVPLFYFSPASTKWQGTSSINGWFGYNSCS